MPRASSTSAEVTFLDNAAAREALGAAARDLLAADANVEAVYLFGSLAAGRATPDSDADVLVVVKEATGRWFDRGDFYRERFLVAGPGLNVELFVYTRAELDRMKAAGNAFIAEMTTTAASLATR